MTRIFMVLIGCVAVVTACERDVSGVPASGSVADTSILSPAAVQELSGIGNLSRAVDTDQPVSDTYLSEGPCHQVSDQRTAFGDDWTAFRSVADTVPVRSGQPPAPMVSLVQNIVAYTDGVAARTVYDRYVESMVACAASGILGDDQTVDRRDEETAVWVAGGMTSVLAIDESTLVGTSAVAVPDAEYVAIEMSRAILDRIG